MLQSIRSILPFGVVDVVPPERGADFGIVMQCGEKELSAVKLQPPDCEERVGVVLFEANRTLIAHALGSYLRQGFSGLLLPCTYLREKGNNRVESGIALFGFPAPTGRECESATDAHPLDPVLGRGYGAMMMGFMQVLQSSSQVTGVPLQPIIGFDVRKFRQLGTLGLACMSIAADLVCLKSTISDSDPAWPALLAAGVTRVLHMPSLPAVIRDDQLSAAKGQG